ncbi:DNA primase [Mycoplasmopsis gallinarum]|uniref:DNA primase n=1 Tax=Mycoplasmopsis gallinarum TaxID=29557 RepID=UPI0006889B01|nr:DNA primase [Mycoplasmopsis gallinarum]
MKNISSLINEILSKADIVKIIEEYIQLKKNGRNYVAICPFHNDTSPSMQISQSKQIFKCFACGVGGNAIAFISKYKKIPFYSALNYLADKYGINYDSNLFAVNAQKIEYTEQQKKIIELLDRVNNFYKIKFQLDKTLVNEKLKQFAEKRQISEKIADYFNIGYADEKSFTDFFNDDLKENIDVFVGATLYDLNTKKLTFRNRVTFAIQNEEGHVVGFSARTLEKEEKPKYINSAETELFQKSKILYNFYNANQSLNNNTIIITEGFFDVIALYKAGFDNAVALMGTALTKNHLELLKNKQVILFLDGDSAGQNATYKSLLFLLENNILPKIVNNKSTNDPDELYEEKGAEHLQKLLNKTITAFEFAFYYLINKHQIDFSQMSKNITGMESFINFKIELVEVLKYANDEMKMYFQAYFKNNFDFDLVIPKLNHTNQIYKIKKDQFTIGKKNINKNFSYKNNVVSYTKSNFNVIKEQEEMINVLQTLYYMVLNHPDLYKIFYEMEYPRLQLNDGIQINLFLNNNDDWELFEDNESEGKEFLLAELYARLMTNKFLKEEELTLLKMEYQNLFDSISEQTKEIINSSYENAKIDNEKWYQEQLFELNTKQHLANFLKNEKSENDEKDLKEINKLKEERLLILKSALIDKIYNEIDRLTAILYKNIEKKYSADYTNEKMLKRTKDYRDKWEKIYSKK